MKKLKNILLTAVFAVMLSITGLFLSSCGEAGRELEISSSIESGEIELFVGESQTIYFTVSNFGSAESGKVSISVYDDAGAGSDQTGMVSEHIYLSTPQYNNNGITTIEITGRSGGETRLIATTSGGSTKSLKLDINVREYASSVEDVKGKHYVSLDSAFVPSIDNYFFGSTTTEKNLAFYIDNIAFENDYSGEKIEFTKVELIEKNNQKYLQFTGKNEELYTTFDPYEDGEKLTFWAEYDNPYEDVAPVQSSFTVVFGFREEEISFVSETEPVDSVQLIAYKTGGNKAEFTVRLPENNNLVFDYEVKDPSLISVISLKNGNDYTITISNKVSKKAQTEIVFNAYYPDFKGVKSQTETLVSYSKTIPVDIAVMPTDIRVNGESSKDNFGQTSTTYTLYNNNVDDYGWQELDVGIYREDASFTGYVVDFEEDEIQVRLGKDKPLSRGYTVSGNELSQSLFIRGSNKAGELFGELSLKVQSYVFDESDELSIKVKYQIKQGANNLRLTDADYEYSSLNEDGGIYLAPDAEERTFDGLVADAEFDKVIIEQISTGNPAVQLTVDKNYPIKINEFGHIIPLSVKPLGKGTTTFKIILDNGRSKDITFKVIDEFEGLILSQFTGNGASNNGFFDISSESENGNITGEVIVRTGDNSAASINLSSAAGKDVIAKYDEPTREGDDCIRIAELQEKGTYNIFAEKNGMATLNFTVRGIAIDGWKLNNNVQKTAEIKVICYTLASEFVVKSKDKVVKSVVVSRNENETIEERSAEFNAEVDSSAFGFREYSNDTDYEYKAQGFNNNFLYWLSDSSIYDGYGNPCNKMVYGNVYKIGGISTETYIGTFDTTSMTFIANAAYTGSISSVRLYATISQYGSTKYYPIDIKIEDFTSVSNISFESKWNGVKSVSFNSMHREEKFIVYLTPTNPKVEGLFVRFIRNGEGEPLFVGDLNENVVSLGNGAYLVSLKVNEAVFSADKVAEGTLEFIPKAWMNGNSITSSNASKVLMMQAKYENGSKTNPYSITTAEQLIAIGDSAASMSAHYVIDRPINISGKNLPIGADMAFSGSIRGISTTAAITGITISQGASGNFGLFSKITGEIRNLAFSGSINASINSDANVGVIAGINEGRLINVSVNLFASNVAISAGEVYVGGLVGQNLGQIRQDLTGVKAYYDEESGEDAGDKLISISSLITVFMQQPLTINSTNTNAKVYAGGIAGLTSSNIQKTKDVNQSYYNYSEYTAYTRINASGYGSAYIGGIAGKIWQETSTSEYISGLLVGGRLEATNSNNYVGGIAGEFGNYTRLTNISTRTFVKGSNVGAAAGNVFETTAGSIHIENITIEAINEGEKITANGTEMPMPMIIDTGINVFPTGENDVNGKLAFVVAPKYNGAYTWIKEAVSYVKDTTGKYADYIKISEESIQNSYSFDKGESSLAILSTNEGFHEMTAEGEESKDKVYYMYYFEADSYLQAGVWTKENIAAAQDKLDETLNRVKISSSLCPFKLSANSSVVSKNNIITISGDELIVNGTGLAELNISNILDQTLEYKVYINVINYFDVNAYGIEIGKIATPFVVGGETITQTGTEVVLYENAVSHINVEPVYKKNVFGYSIDANAELTIDNMTIRLAKKAPISSEIVQKDEGLTYYSYEIGENLISLSRANNPTSDDANEVVLSAKLTRVINGKTYSHLLGSAKLLISYKQGTTAIVPGIGNYIMNPSMVRSDVVYLETDDLSDTLNVQIKDGNENTDLFNIEKTKKTGAGNYAVSISIKKDSQSYKNRFTKNIYHDYKVVYSGKNGYEKIVILTLENISLRPIVIDNYESIKDQSITSNEVVPGQRGLLSISITPADADFSAFRIKNSSKNYDNSSAIASLQMGSLEVNDKNEMEFVQFTNGVKYFSGGLEITRQALIDNGYDGQIFLQYSFAKNVSVQDGKKVGFDVELIGLNGEPIEDSHPEYSINNKVKFDISIANKDYSLDEKFYLARGLSYKLDIINNAYDADSITITTDNSQYAKVEQIDGEYYLKVLSDIPNLNSNRGFKLIYSASRTSALGEIEDFTETKNCDILEYVINYHYDSTLNPADDIISGMNNGTIAVALGNKVDFNLDFSTKNYLEYDSKDQTISAAVRAFLSAAKTSSEWNVYTDLVMNTTDSIVNSGAVLPITSQSEVSAVSEIGSNDISTPYFDLVGYSFTPRRIHEPSKEQHYSISFETVYKIENGRYVIDNTLTDDKNKIRTEFSIVAYLRGSDESPNPIYDYATLKEALKVEGHYILMNDIEVSPDEFEMIAMSADSFDGNGYKIILTGQGNDENGNIVQKPYKLGAQSSFGIFSSISEKSVLKNLTVQVGKDGQTGEVRFDSDQTSGLQFAILAANNAGIITNCKVMGATDSLTARLNYSTTPRSSGFYMSGLVSSNTGKITNSQVELSMRSNCSIAGFVANNSGDIASSYFKGSSIFNESEQRDVFYTAGFAISNSENANIITSYTAGIVDENKIHAPSVEKRLDSGVSVAGFIATNYGKIRDCYSNIPIRTDAISAGFAFANAKEIKNCFSTSIIMGDNSNTNAYFVKLNQIEGKTGSFENCFYLSDSSEDAKYQGLSGEIKGINTTLQKLEVDGLEGLTVKTVKETDKEGNEIVKSYGFDALAEKFASYAYATNGVQAYSSVWFMPDDIGDDYFNAQAFSKGRLELTSANLIAFSRRILVEQSLDANGFTTYIYKTADGVAENGSATNPYMVYTADQLEDYLTAGRNGTQSKAFIRLVGDIDYSKASVSSQLSKLDFAGVMDGNGMSISGVEVYSDEKMDSAGFFGKIKGTTQQYAAVMNLSLVPSVVSFANSNIVGGLAGTVQRANIYNVKVLNNIGEENGDSSAAARTLIVSGKNIVGGVVGRATDTYNLKNVVSLVGAKATYITTSTQDATFMDSAIGTYSYAGGVVGYADGSEGQIANLQVYGAGAIAIGAKVGLIAGGLARNVSVNEVDITISSDILIRAYVYGGLVVGESRANLSNIFVKGSGTSFEVFRIEPYTPVAVGGIVGRAVGGTIRNVYMGQSFEVEARSQVSGGLQTIASVGGIAGRVEQAQTTIENAVIEANITARRVLGGVVGQVASTKLSLKNVALHRGLLTLTGLTPTPYIGGFIGDVASTAIVEITDAYSLADIAVSCYVYSNTITANVGAIIGNSNGSLTLSNIYTTTEYDIALQDNTSSKVIAPVYAENKGNIDPTNPGNTSYDWELNFNQDGKRVVDYTLNTFTATDVYFYAYQFDKNHSGHLSYYDAILNGGPNRSEANKTTRFSVKIDNKNMSLVQNEYGQGIYNYLFVKNNGAADWTTKNPMVSEQLFNGLFTSPEYPNWKENQNELPSLKFEDSLLKKAV